MTAERLVTEYTADTRNFRRGARVYDQTLARQERLTNDRLSRIDRRWERSTRSILNTRTALVGLTGYVGTQALRELRNYAEGWRDVERRLQSIGVVSAEGQKNLVQLALRTRSAVGGTATIVQRFQRSTGAGIEITTRRVETLQKLLAVQGATGTERNALGIQLGQALQSGVLSGDEFRTIRENSPVEFLDALAKAAGVTRRQLKATAEDQKLTTEVVLRALDSMADVADEKFGDLAMSGDEAFNTLQTGLTVYVGNVDKALGATETINGALAWLGEYLSDAGDGAETMAQAIQIVGTMALAVAGSRGLGALNAAFQRSAETARFAAQEAQKEVAVSRQKVVAAQQELAASRALVAQRQAEVTARMQSNRKLTGALKSLEAAKRKNAKASVALAGAEARAAVATDRLTAAQRRLSVAARASAAALRTAKSVLAFFGGPLGLAITALTTLPFLLKDVDDRLTALQGVSDQAMQAMDRYAEASKRAGEEQERLGGKISGATQAMLVQARAEMQSELRQLKAAFEDTMSDMESQGRRALQGIFHNFVEQQEIRISARAEEGFAQRIQVRDTIRELEYIGDIFTGIEQAMAGGSLVQLAEDLDRLRGIGREAQDVFLAFQTAAADTAAFDEAKNAMLSYAQAAGIFEEQLKAISAAEGPEAQRAAYDQLALAIYQAYRESVLLGDGAIEALAAIVKGGSVAELQMQAMEASLVGNTDEAARLRAMLEDATGQAMTLGSTNISGPITAAANEAGRLAQNLAAARAQAIDKITGGNPDFFDPRNESGNAGRIIRPRGVPAQNQPGYTPPSGGGGRRGGGGSGGGASARDAERDLAAARELLVENGQKALYIEQELNSERERLREMLPALIELGLSRADAEAVINSELERTEERLKRVKSASEEAAEAFAKGILADIRHADSLGDAIGRISDRLLDLALDPVFDFLAQQFASLVTGGGGGGVLGQIFGFLFSASGNAFNSAGVVPFARGGVVDRPTLFNYAGNRKGVMGEAGPEAILPLSRGKNGKLGVVAELPTTPSMPAGSMQANSTFSWTGDMVIQSNSDEPQEVGREAAEQMRAMFIQMFGKQLYEAMRGGGILDSTYQKKAGA